jgi:hypothetical protein
VQHYPSAEQAGSLSRHTPNIARFVFKHLALFVLAAGALLLLAALYTAAQRAPVAPPPIQSAIPLAEVRGVNYVRSSVDDPDTCPDLQYGQDGNCPWDMAPIEADMDRLRAHGVNTLRIFLNYYTFGGASETNPDYTMDAALAHLDTFIAAAHERDMYVMPILLSKYPQDRFGPDHYTTTLELHVRPVVQHLAGREGVLAWDLFNEPDIGSPIDQRCWDWDNADFPLCFPLANERLHFLRVVGDTVREHDPGTPITIGMAFAKSYFEPEGTDLSAAELVDFFSFHYYDDDPYDSGRYQAHWYYGEGFPADLRRGIAELREIDADKPIVISELGFPSGPDALRTPAEVQRDLARAVEVAMHEENCGLLLWPFQHDPAELIGPRFGGG